MERVKQFVEGLTTHGGPREWGELDVEEMFPNIPCPLVVTALRDLWTALCAACDVPKNGFFFHTIRMFAQL